LCLIAPTLRQNPAKNLHGFGAGYRVSHLETIGIQNLPEARKNHLLGPELALYWHVLDPVWKQ